VDFFSKHPDVGIVGGRLLNLDGSIQWSQRRFPSILNQLSESLYLHFLFPTSPWAGEVDKRAQDYSCTTYPDWVSGAFLSIKRELLEQIGPLDEAYFMYCEDMDWCYHCWKKGWKVAYLPDACVTHSGALSSSQEGREHIPRMVRSKLVFYRKCYGFLHRLVMRGLLCLGLFQKVVLFLFAVPFLPKRKYSFSILFLSRVRGLCVALFGRTP